MMDTQPRELYSLAIEFPQELAENRPSCPDLEGKDPSALRVDELENDTTMLSIALACSQAEWRLRALEVYVKDGVCGLRMWVDYQKLKKGHAVLFVISTHDDPESVHTLLIENHKHKKIKDFNWLSDTPVRFLAYMLTESSKDVRSWFVEYDD